MCICQSERHNQKLVMAVTSSKCCFGDVLLSDSQLMVARSQINLRVITRPLQLIEQIVDAWKRLTVFTVPFFFFTNNTGAPQGEELGRTKPFSKRSCSCVDSSSSSVGARRYGARATGNSSGDTSGKSRTIGISSIFISSADESETRARIAVWPFRKHFWALRKEMMPTTAPLLSPRIMRGSLPERGIRTIFSLQIIPAGC
ncbi:hypothetical protein Hanom_Chr08g00737211 [Helianthus anomalus]